MAGHMCCDRANYGKGSDVRGNWKGWWWLIADNSLGTKGQRDKGLGSWSCKAYTSPKLQYAHKLGDTLPTWSLFTSFKWCIVYFIVIVGRDFCSVQGVHKKLTEYNNGSSMFWKKCMRQQSLEVLINLTVGSYLVSH